MVPVYIILKANKLYVTSDLAAALALGGTCFKCASDIGYKTPYQLATISGAGSPYTFTAATGVVTGAYPAKANVSE